MYDNSFEHVREEALNFMFERNKRLIEAWCEEAGVRSQVGFYNNLCKHVMQIYTDKPGFLIGLHGRNVDKFKENLKQEFCHDYEVEFIEVRGGFVNLKKMDA